jgi:type IV pilus assembly protein PilW
MARAAFVQSSARQRGISMVEIMVALTLSLVLVGGILTVYLVSKQTYRSADAFSRIQENARIAFDMLGRDMRMAGYPGCAGSKVFDVSSEVPVVNTLNDSTGFLWNFAQAIYGYEATSSSAWNATLDAAVSALSPLGGRDIVILRGAFGDDTRVLQHPGGTPPGSADLKVSVGASLSEGDIVLVTDCLGAAIFQITNSNTAGGFENEVHNTGSIAGMVPGNATQDLGKNFEGGEILRISTKLYYIANNTAGQPALFRKEATAAAVELVEGVQDMQILYGVDDPTNCGSGQAGDAAVDCYQNGQWVENNGLWNNVVATKVALLLRSTDAGVVNTPQTYTFNGATVTAPDTRLYQPSETTFTLRNRVN